MARSTPKDFTRAVQRWTHDTLTETSQTFRDAVSEFTDELVEAAPKVSGNLARSIQVTNGLPVYVGKPDQKYADPSADNQAAIASLELGDTARVAVGAAYALKTEVGYQSRGADGKLAVTGGRFWATSVGSRWKGIVQRIATARRRG